jgi:hypothetical protein
VPAAAKPAKSESVGQKLFKQITQQKKEVTTGAKLDNPFAALLELDAE